MGFKNQAAAKRKFEVLMISKLTTVGQKEDRVRFNRIHNYPIEDFAFFVK